MKLATLISALRKCEREMGWYEGCYQLEPGGLFHPDDHRPVKCQRQADKFAAAIIKRFKKVLIGNGANLKEDEDG